MEIFSKNQLVEFLLEYTSAPADKPLMVWCGSFQSLKDLFDTLKNKFKPSGKISYFEDYLPDGSAFDKNLIYAESLNSKNVSICTSFVRESRMPLVFLTNDYQIPGEAKRPESPYRWGTNFDIEDLEELMPNNIKDDFIHVCYKPSLLEYIDELKSRKYLDDDFRPIFIDYANSKKRLNYIDPYYFDDLFRATYIFHREALRLRNDNNDFCKKQNAEKLAGEPFTTEAAERRKRRFLLSSNKNVPQDLIEDFIDFLEGTSAAWLFDSTKPHPEPRKFRW